MANINLLRVLLGGLVAGVVLNVGEFILIGLVLAAEWSTLMEKLNLPQADTAQSVAFVVVTFIYGITVVWLYAAIRPRFGPGVKSAVVAGLILWFTTYLLVGITFLSVGLATVTMAVVSIVWGVVEAPLASIAGAWLYREDDTG